MRIDGVSPSADPYRGPWRTKSEPTSDPRSPTTGRALDDKERAQVERLKDRDTEVRAHEAAHAGAAGGLGGGMSFTYETGPDGRRYAVAGEVAVRLASGSTPEETIRNAAQVRAAALAPADPSSQDRAVAAEAAAMETSARAEIATRRREEMARSLDLPGEKPASAEQANQPEPEDTIREIEKELPTTRGGWRHMHADTGCGNCSRAVLAYG